MRESLYLLLVPLVEAFALPGLVERATQKPHANMIYTQCRRCSRTASNDITYPQASTVASSLTNPESCEVSTSQEFTLSKRILFMSPTLPQKPDWASAQQSANTNLIFVKNSHKHFQ